MTRKSEMIEQVAAKTGLPSPLCKKALEAFEDTCGNALANTFKGNRHNRAYVIAEMARRTGETEPTCRAIMEAFEQVLENALRDKLGLGRKRGQ